MKQEHTFVVLGRPVVQSSTLDTDRFDHILFKKHQTALKKTFNAALKRHSTTQRQHGLRLYWIVYAFSSVEAGAVPLKLLTDACTCLCVLTLMERFYCGLHDVSSYIRIR